MSNGQEGEEYASDMSEILAMVSERKAKACKQRTLQKTRGKVLRCDGYVVDRVFVLFIVLYWHWLQTRSAHPQLSAHEQ